LDLLKYAFIYLAVLLYFGMIVSISYTPYLKHDPHNTYKNLLDIPADIRFRTVLKRDQERNEMILGYKLNYLSMPEGICSRENEDDGMLLVLLVHSAVGNRAQRDAIRNTWARSIRQFQDIRIILVFLVGVDQNNRLMTNVLDEGTVYQDLVILGMMDTYRNLSLKSMAGLHWVNTFCGETRFTLKLDDDVYINLPLIVTMLNKQNISDISSYDEKNSHNIENTLNDGLSNMDMELSSVVGHGLVGYVNRKSRVMRHGLWGLEYQQHPEEFYPDYCSGNMYLMNTSAVKLLVKAHYLYSNLNRTCSHDIDAMSTLGQIRFVPFEDVFITGYLAHNIGLTCFHHSGFPHWSVGINRANIKKLIKGQLLGLHNVYYQKMYNLHEMISEKRKKYF